MANRKLAFHPSLAAAAGMRCVRDCAALRAFNAAYSRYARLHPGFEMNELLPPIPALPLPNGEAVPRPPPPAK